jgi:hypothetical protein
MKKRTVRQVGHLQELNQDAGHQDNNLHLIISPTSFTYLLSLFTFKTSYVRGASRK